MRIIPMSVGLVITFALASLAPLLPLLLLAFSFDDLVLRLLKILFGL